MFTGNLVDTRTRQQKQEDNRREQLQQTLMFSQRDLAQFGVNPKPLFSLSPHMKLPLLVYDPRTEEEVARDQQKEPERQTVPLFPELPSYTVHITAFGLKLRAYPQPCPSAPVFISTCGLRVRDPYPAGC